jgi:hypothetical protein
VVPLVIAPMRVLRFIDVDDIASEKSTGEAYCRFTTLPTLADGVNRIGCVKRFTALAVGP